MLVQIAGCEIGLVSLGFRFIPDFHDYMLYLVNHFLYNVFVHTPFNKTP